MRMPPLRIVVFFLLLAAHGLFIWHALYGKRSLDYQRGVRAELAKAREAREDAHLRREELERKVARLRQQTLDSDTLDEEARRELGFIAPGEVLALPDARQ